MRYWSWYPVAFEERESEAKPAQPGVAGWADATIVLATRDVHKPSLVYVNGLAVIVTSWLQVHGVTSKPAVCLIVRERR
jgi:hypothetical protein